MKVFKDDLEKVEVTFIDKDGKEKIKKAKYLTIEDFKKIDGFRNNKKEDEDYFDVLCKQIHYVFGGKVEEYYKYSFPLLKNIKEYITEVYVINPTKPAQK